MALSLWKARYASTFLVLFIPLACRTYDTPAATADAGVDATAAVPDAGPEPVPPTRLEPPVVHVAPEVFVDTVAGSGAKGEVDANGTSSTFDNPVGVFVEPSGSILITEYEGRRLRRVAPDGTTTTLSSFNEPFAVIATKTSLLVQTDRDGADLKSNITGTLWRLPLAGGTPEVVISSLGRPRGLAELGDGRIVVTDRSKNTVSILNPADGSMTPLAGSGVSRFFDGQGTNADFNEPYGVTVLPDGVTIILVDRSNHCLRKVTLDGYVSLFAGDTLPGMKDDDDRLKARFDYPIDVASDSFGNLYVSDSNNHRIRRVSVTGAVETIAGDGTQGFADGPSGAAKFFGQEQIDVTADGKFIYVSDGTGGDLEAPYHRIRRIKLP